MNVPPNERFFPRLFWIIQSATCRAVKDRSAGHSLGDPKKPGNSAVMGVHGLSVHTETSKILMNLEVL